MDLFATINQDLVVAMKEKKETELSTLRLLKSAIKNASIASGKELDDSEIVTIIQREIKQRRDAITQYTQANRQDLVQKEQSELSILEKYLPPQLSDEELSNIVQQVIIELKATSPQDFGKVMGATMPRVKGQADGNRISAIVRNKLTNV